MTDDRHQQASVLFLKAGKLPPDEQKAFLEAECAGQTELRAEVESLLKHEGAGAEMFSATATTATAPTRDPGSRPSAGTRQPLTRPDLTLSHYRLVEKIGEGGMGVVWKAWDTILKRDVAIKVLRDHVIDDPQRRKQFLEEAQLASRVGDAHIVQIYDFGHEQGLDFLVMEYVDGRPLSDLLHGRPLPPHKVARYGAQVARAIARAHDKKLLHRDIKPSNILITARDEVKVVDFGLATLFRPAGSTVTTESIRSLPSERTSRLIVGTLPYMSPEQITGGRLDTRSDIFSLGTVLYEMTTGHHPFLGDTPEEIREKITRTQPPPPHTLVREIPMDLESILRKILALRRGERYQTMGDLAVDLNRLCRALDDGTALWFGKVQPEPKRSWWLRTSLYSVGLILATFVTAYIIHEINKPLPLPPPSPDNIYYLRGLDYYQRLDEDPRNLHYAIQMFHRAVEAEPGHARAWAKLGEASWLRFDESRDESWKDEAQEAVLTAFRVQPGLPEAHLARGYGLLLRGQLEDARDELLQAVHDKNDLDRAWVVLGQVYQRLGDYAESRKAFDRALELKPEDYRYHLWLGYFFEEFSENDASIEAFKRACDLSPASTKAWNSLAGALLRVDRPEEARDALVHSVEIEETDFARNLLGTAWYYLGDYEKAAESYRRATSLRPDYAPHWANLGDALKSLDLQNEARDAYAQAARLALQETLEDPLDAVARRRAGLYCARAGDYECAIREGKTAEALQPENAETLFRVAIMFYLASEVEEALDRLEESVRHGKSRVEIENDPDLVGLKEDPRFQRILQLAS